METGSQELVILSYATVYPHPSVSLNNEKKCRDIGEDKTVVCENCGSTEWKLFGFGFSMLESVRFRKNRDLKIDDAANLDGAVLKCMNKKSFLKCGNCNKRLKFILVACKQFCLAKLCPICYKMDFQNTSHVVAFIAVAQGTL